MKKKSKSTTNQTTVQTPTNPEWVTQPTQDVAGKISALGNLDPYSLVAGADPLQTQAATSAGALGADRGWYDKIMGAQSPDIQAQQVQSASVLDGLPGYMSPYTNDVVNTSLADFDHSAGKTRAQQTLDMAGAGAFGGSGSALTRSETEGELARSRASLDAGLRDQAFNTGAGLSGQDAARRQAASESNATNHLSADTSNANLYQELLALQGQTGLGGEQSQRSNIALQSDIGQQLRAIEQARLGAPVSLAATQAGLLGSLPLNLFNGQTSTMNGTTTSKSSDPMGTLGSLAMVAAAPFTGGASLAGLGGLFAGSNALKANAASLASNGLAGWGS